MKIWMDERGADRKLTIISGDTFYVDDSDKTDFSAAEPDLANGAEPMVVLHEKADRIPLAAIFRVESDETNTQLTVHFRKDKDKDSETWFYSTGQVRDEIVAALKAALGESFDTYKDSYSVIRAVYGSLMTITITVLLSWILVGAARAIRSAEDLEISGKNSLIKRMFAGALDLLGPTGVMIVCWLVVILALFNLYKRASTPPMMTIIQAEPYKPATVAGTAVRYLMLFVLVFITARVIA